MTRLKTSSRWLRVALLGAVVPFLFAGTSPQAHPGRPARVAEAQAPKVVGEVTVIAGSKALFLEVKDGKEKLHEGDELHLNDVVLAGKGVKATLQIDRPHTVSPDKELVFVRPVGTTKHLLLIHRNDQFTIVKITS